MADLASLSIILHGRVQGVAFRHFAQQEAALLHLKGWVRNLPDGEDVQVQAEGEREKLQKLIGLLKKGPARAIVESARTKWGEYSGVYSDFRIHF